MITNLIDDGPCDQTVRELRVPDGISCPSCESTQVIKRGVDDTEPAPQRDECPDGHTRVDELTDTIVAGHHQPLNGWIRCLYGMGLHLSNDHMAHELDVERRDVHQMTTPWRQGIVKKATGDPVTRGGVRRSLCECRP
jgi:transposase-like protein